MRKFDLSNITKAPFFEQLLVVLAILLTLPVIQPFYSAFIMGAEQLASAGVVSILYVAIPLLIIGSLLSRKILPLVVIVPAVYYLLYLNNLVVSYSPYVVVPAAIVSFIYIVLKGHVRSFAFVVLVVYSFVLYEWYSAAILSITFIFARFLALVVLHNYNIFNTLGLRKSLVHLGKSFLYWSPLLIIIIPVSRLQTNINEQITSEIYQLTPVDTLKYYHVNMLTDSLENLMEAKKGVSSIIYIDSINGRRKEVFKLELPDIKEAHFALNNSDTFQLSLPVLGSMQYFVYNKLDLEMVSQNSSFIHEVLYDAYKESDTKLDTSINLSVNEFISGQTINNALFNYENSKLLTFINKPEDSKEPYVLICKNINIPDPDYVNDNLNEDIEVSLAYLFVSFSNNMVKSLREDNMKFELPELSTSSLINREAIDEKKREVYKTIDDHRDRTWQKVNKEIDEVLPEPLLKTESAKFWEVKKLITNAIKRSVNKKYSKEKQKLKKKIQRKIYRIYTNVTLKVDHVFETVERQIDYVEGINTGSVNKYSGELTAMSGNLVNSIEKNINNQVTGMLKSTIRILRSTFLVLFFYGLLGTLSFVYLIVQTYLYIFSRVTISEKNQIFATLNHSTKELPKGKIRTCGDTYTIDPGNDEVFYISRVFEPSGMPPKFCVPYPKVSALPRMKSKVYAMNKVKPDNEQQVQFRATGSSCFVEWHLIEGEEVVFNYQNLVAFTSTVKLKSVANLQVTTLLLGKLLYKVAVGPGKIVLLTKGRPIVGEDPDANASIALNRILAWSTATRFDIRSELSLVDVYLSGFYLQKMDADLIVIDADAKGKASTGLIQYVKGLIWPF